MAQAGGLGDVGEAPAAVVAPQGIRVRAGLLVVEEGAAREEEEVGVSIAVVVAGGGAGAEGVDQVPEVIAGVAGELHPLRLRRIGEEARLGGAAGGKAQGGPCGPELQRALGYPAGGHRAGIIAAGPLPLPAFLVIAAGRARSYG